MERHLRTSTLTTMAVRNPSQPQEEYKVKSHALGKVVDDVGGVRREAATQGVILAGAAVVVVLVMATGAVLLLGLVRWAS